MIASWLRAICLNERSYRAKNARYNLATYDHKLGEAHPDDREDAREIADTLKYLNNDTSLHTHVGGFPPPLGPLQPVLEQLVVHAGKKAQAAADRVMPCRLPPLLLAAARRSRACAVKSLRT